MKKKAGIFRIKEIMEQVYLIRNTAVSMILVVGEERALLFDTGYGFDGVTEIIREITDKPFDVVLSHGHVDHAGGTWEFEEVYLHPADWEVFERHSSKPYREWGLELVEVYNKIPFIKILPDGFDRTAYIRQPKGNVKAVREGDVFSLGGLELQVIELPGHTPGSIGLYCPEKKLVLVSDAVNGNLFLFLEESGTLKEYKNTLYKLKNVDFEYMLQAHPSCIFSKEVLEDYIEVAEHPDWEHGKIRKNDLLSGNKIVKTVRSTVNPKNKAKIVIDESRL